MATPPSGVAGRIAQDTTWRGQVLLTGTVVVERRAVLTVSPGTQVRFRAYRGYRDPERRLNLIVRGRIIAEGTPEAPIYFTSDASDARNGDWSMVRLMSPDGECRFRCCVFEFGQQGLNAWQASPRIDQCVFRWNNWEGVYFESFCRPTLYRCLIYENGYNGLAAEQSNQIRLDGCEVWRNGTSGVHIDNSTAEILRSRVHDNLAHGLSVDDGATMRALGVAVYGNHAFGVGVGEGRNTLEFGGLDLRDNRAGAIGGRYAAVPDAPPPPEAIDLGFVPDASRALGYIPGDRQRDRYAYVYPDDETRRIGRRIGDGLGLTWSLAWDGRSIWTATLWNRVYRLDPASGAVLDEFELKGSPPWGTPSQPWGMTFDDEGMMWIVDFAERKLFRIDLRTRAITFSCDTPNPREGGCKGLAWDGACLNVLGWREPVIYRMTKDGRLVGSLRLDHGGGGGLAWDGQHFWVPGGRILKYDAAGRQVGWIYPASEGTWDMAWDGSHLWASQRTNENWRDAKIFRLDLLDDHDPAAR